VRPVARELLDAPTVRPGWPGGEPRRGAFWRAIVRHRWALLAVFLLTMVAAAAWAILVRPVFSATVFLRVDREEPRVLKFDQVVREDGEVSKGL
jgi:uncharacterized protein involved in exopolysaccharide biosynthesis